MLGERLHIANLKAQKRFRIYYDFPDKADYERQDEWKLNYPGWGAWYEVPIFRAGMVKGVNGNAPKHFRQCLNRIYKAKAKQALIHGKEVPVWKANAGWLWW